MRGVLHGSFYLGRPGLQLYHRYVIPAQPVATGKSNYRMTHFNASLSTQLVSCSKGFFWTTWAHLDTESCMVFHDVRMGLDYRQSLLPSHHPLLTLSRKNWNPLSYWTIVTCQLSSILTIRWFHSLFLLVTASQIWGFVVFICPTWYWLPSVLLGPVWPIAVPSLPWLFNLVSTPVLLLRYVFAF